MNVMSLDETVLAPGIGGVALDSFNFLSEPAL